MNKTISVSFIPLKSNGGDELKGLFISLAEELGLEPNLLENPSQADFFNACKNDDVVVFDASIEYGKDNYHAATAQPMSMDHVLVVSRTYLPQNFYGLRYGGAPYYPKMKDNNTIIKWLRWQIKDLLPLLPRPKESKSNLGSIKVMKKSLEFEDLRRKNTGQVFISYRGKYISEVRKLKDRIECGEYHSGQSKTVRYFPPGALAYDDELLTEQQRWQLLSIIDRWMWPAEEIWLYGTPDYPDSWWTRGELVALSYRCSYDGDSVPNLRIYNPDDGRIGEINKEFLPRLSEEQRRRIARWYSNSDPGTMGPESLQMMRFMSSIPLIRNIGYFKDHVWTKEFWDFPLMQCINCGTIIKDNAIKTSLARTNVEFDVEAFVWSKEPVLFRLAPEYVMDASKRGEIECPKCKKQYNLKGALPRYLWMPTRMGKATGPGGASLKSLPTYRITPRI